MKTLIIGIDGGDLEVFKKMKMRFLESVNLAKESYILEEDLWSRGWAEILSGKHGLDSGAFYNKPLLDGSYGFTQKYNTLDYETNPDITPLWQKLNESGLKIGFMNIPTTMPAPKVDGFFVSGAGGGMSKDAEGVVSENACYPKEIKYKLECLGYIMDTRFMSSGIKNISQFSDRLCKMLEKRTEAFIELNYEYNVDVGFVSYMGISRMMYLAYSEFINLLDNFNSPKNEIQTKFIELYQTLDKTIRRLLSALNPSNIIYVSDHSHALRKYNINLNAFLADNGYQNKINLSVFRQLRPKFINSIKPYIPNHIKSKLSKTIKRSVNNKHAESIAFGERAVSGIYINSSKIFNTNVIDNEKVIDEIIDKFNQNGEAKKLGLSARKYLESHNRVFSDHAPDIWIEHPDEVFYVSKGKFIQENKAIKEKITNKTLKKVTTDIYTGIKGRHPLCIVITKSNLDVNEVFSQKKDLTAIYDLVVRLCDDNSNVVNS